MIKVVLICVFLLWPIGLLFNDFWILPQRVDADLNKLENQLLTAQRKNGSFPRSFLEVENTDSSRSITPYDPFGRLYDLITFRNGHYILRSFGIDGEENTPLKFPDPYRAKLAVLPQEMPIRQAFLNPAEPQITIIPAPLYSQSVSRDGIWVAERHTTSDQSLAGRLIVRGRKSPYSNLLLVCPDRDVTEFLWFANSKSIAYLVENAQTVRLKVWNLYSGETSVVEIKNSPEKALHIEEQKDKNYSLMLAGITFDHRVLFHKVPLHQPMDWSDLTNGKFLMQAVWNLESKKFQSTNFKSQQGTSTFDISLKNGYRIESKKEGMKSDAIKKWMSIPTAGNTASLINSWQDAAVSQLDSLGTAQLLTILVSIYYEAYDFYKLKNQNEARLLRDFGLRLATQNLNQRDLPGVLYNITKSYELALKGQNTKEVEKLFKLRYESLTATSP